MRGFKNHYVSKIVVDVPEDVHGVDVPEVDVPEAEWKASESKLKFAKSTCWRWTYFFDA